MAEPQHAWVFEVNSIQDYLFETGRLADAVGASLLVDRLTGDLGDTHQPEPDSLLHSVLAACGVQLGFTRCGGGAFVAHGDGADIRRARALWHATLLRNAPGLRWSDGVGSASLNDSSNSLEAARQQAQSRGQFERPCLPESTPAMARVPRTGQAAAALERIGAKGQEWVDAATLTRRRHRHHNSRTLTDRFHLERDVHWPINMEAGSSTDHFPFLGSSRDVAILHADGNGLGAKLRRLPKTHDAQRAFSMAVAASTRAAAAHATLKVLRPAAETCGGVMPARPLVLGGDDLILIVRADLAVDFAREFLLAFERVTEREFGAGQGLTAACGLAITKAGFPFARATELAGELCDRAKQAIKLDAHARGVEPAASALALARIEASLSELVVPTTQDGRALALQTYVVNSPSSGLPSLDSLLLAARALSHLPQGPARRLLTDLHGDIALARARWRRMGEIGREKHSDHWTALQQALQQLGVPTEADLPFTAQGSPWVDVLQMRDLLQASEANLEDAS